MNQPPSLAPPTSAFITNSGTQSLIVPGLPNPVPFSNHLEFLRVLLAACDGCLLESPFLYQDFAPLVHGLNLAGKSVELISTCAVKSEDQLDKPYSLRNFGQSFKAATGSWPVIHLNQALHSKIYLFYRNEVALAGVVTSANLTGSGLTRSHETGVLVTEHAELEKLAKIARSRLDFVYLTEYQIGQLCAAADWYQGDYVRRGDVNVGLGNILNTYVTPGAGNPGIQLASTATYYIKISGVTDHPILPENCETFDEPHTTLGFAKNPSNIRLGDCLLEVAVGGKCFLPYYACASMPFERTPEEQAKNADFKRWPYYVWANNFALRYGANWFKAPIYYDPVVEDFKRVHPGISVTQAGKVHFVPAMQMGNSYILVTREFGEFVRQRIDAWHTPQE